MILKEVYSSIIESFFLLQLESCCHFAFIDLTMLILIVKNFSEGK